MRTSIRRFSLANDAYVGATVSFYTVDGTGAKTTTLATLYESPTGTGTLSNPQTLDSEGKFPQPVYIDAPVVATVSGLSIADHDTGIIHNIGKWRGNWATATIYYPGEWLMDPDTYDLYVVEETHTSGTFATDVTDGKIAQAVNNLTWKGAHSGATAYVENDLVASAGITYICILAHSGQTPPNATYWEVFSAAVVFSSATPVVSSGAGSAGTSGEAARGDHVHPSAKDVAETLTNKTMDSLTNFLHADAIHVKTRNETGGTLARGTAVHADAYNSGQDAVTVILADASDPTKMPAYGIVDQAMLNNANGKILTKGLLVGDPTDPLDTSAYAEGDELYISETPGGLTNVRPTAKDSEVQKIATVLRSHASLGAIFINGAGRSNSLPNSATAEAGFLGKSYDLGNLNSATTLSISNGNFQHATMTGSFTLTAPNDTDEGVIVLEFTIDATGGYTLTLSGFNEVSGTVDTSANVVNILKITKSNTNTYLEITQAV